MSAKRVARYSEPPRANVRSLGELCVGVRSPLLDALAALDQGGIEIVFVADRGLRILGTLSDGDVPSAILRGVSLEQRGTVTEVMQPNFTSVGPAVRRAEVLDLMRARGINQTPVVDAKGKMIGLHLLHELLGAVQRPNRAVIMAGDQGVRLRPLTETVPKPMLKVAGRPILERWCSTWSAYGQMSEVAMWAIGGIVRHGRSIQPLTNPTANSFRRLIPGYEAPVKLAYSAVNHSAGIRIPFAGSEKGRRIEFRCPDSSGSPYMAFAAILMAMIDGIQNKIDPGPPLDKNIYELSPEELSGYVSTCATQEEAIEELEKDNEWLMAGNVFTEDTLEAYVAHRGEEEVEPLKLRPNPYEFSLYYDC